MLLAAFTSAAAAAFAATWPAGGYRYAVVAASVAAFEVVSLNSAGVSIVLASTLLPFLLVTPWFAQYETRLTTD